MRVHHCQPWYNAGFSKRALHFRTKAVQNYFANVLVILLFPLAISTIKASNAKPFEPCVACDNVTSGGAIAADEFGCPNPTWDPSIIVSTALPTGGSGALEYVWMSTTGDPNSPLSQWDPIPGSNGPDYDPGPISVTTYYRRCSRRAGCLQYTGETDYVTKEAICCDNVTGGGGIAASQLSCQSPFDPSALTNVSLPTGGSNALEFQWASSTTGTPYSPSNPDWNFIAGANSDSFDPASLNQTTYFVRLSRRHGCLDYAGVSNMVAITISDNLAASAVGDNVTCFGGQDGSIELTPTGGTMPYTFLWTGNLGTIEDPQSITAGSYSVTVTDANGCTATTGATVLDGEQLLISTVVNSETCGGANNGSATVSVQTGTPPYNYIWSSTPVQSNAQAVNLAPGQYVVTVIDGLGCAQTDIITVNAGPPIDVTVTSTNVVCLGENQGTAEVFSIANGSGVYSYLWSPGGATSSAIDSLYDGDYTVVVSDNQGCTGSATATVADGPQILANASHTDATCNYTTDGTATVAPSGGLAPYIVVWSDPASQTTFTASSLAAGNYTVTITDANGCTTIYTETVEAPLPLDVVGFGTDVNCFNGTDGTVSVSVVNGNPADYNYLWNNPNASSTATVTGLQAGTYTVTVSDNNGCVETESVTIGQPTQLTVLMDSGDATCGNGSDGFVNATVSGGTPVYNFQWSLNNGPNANGLDDVSPGNYTVTVSDANGCTVVGSATIGAPPVLLANIATTNISCNGLNNGALTVTATGGVSPYTYQWSNASNGTSILNLAAGTYNVVVTDAVGCVANASATVTEPPVLTINLMKIDVICTTDTDGSTIALPTGGTLPYTYSWSTGQASQNIGNLGVGTYSVTVSDANGCTATGSSQIIATTTLDVVMSATDANCFSSNDGAALATVTGGTSPFIYSWNNGVSTASNTNLIAATYSVTVTDGDGCIVSDDVVVSSPPQLTSPISIITPITNYGGSNGSIKTTATGGVAPYNILWNTSSNNATLTGLTAGAYSVTVTDAHNCTVSASINLTNPSKIGNFVWSDLNQNGIQETGEPGMDSVKLHLIGATSTGTQVHFTTYSDTTGFYAFDGLAAGVYQVKVDLPAIHVFSPINIGNDLTDSDINPVDSSTALINLPIGNYESRWDVGLIELDEKINIGDFVWQDADQDGIQDQQEQGLANYTVRLYSMPGNTLVATKVTNNLGKYLFTDVLPGSYQIEFLLANLPNGHFYGPQNQGTNDNLDSDPDPTTGRTATFQVFPYTVDNLTIDAAVYKECDNVTDGGLIGYNESLCGLGADPAEIVNLSFPSGGFGTLEYLWLKSSVPVYNGPGDPNWSPIPNSNSPNYDPGPINQSTYYIRCSRRQGCPDYPGESNSVAKSLTPNPLAQIIDQPVQVCKNISDRFEAAIAGGGATYFWDFGADAVPATATTRVVNAVSWTTDGVKNVSLTVSRLGCSVTVNTTVTVTICGNPLIINFDDIFTETNGDVVDLYWSVSGLDTTNTLFMVQRSENGQDFTSLGALSGNEFGAGGMFHFTDHSPRLGENIYRIKYHVTGDNEANGYSPLASAMHKPVGSKFIQLYPNPTPGNLTVEFLKASSNTSTVQICDAFGRIILDTEIPANTEKMEFDLSGHPLGVYWVRINSENVREQLLKVVKTE